MVIYGLWLYYQINHTSIWDISSNPIRQSGDAGDDHFYISNCKWQYVYQYYIYILFHLTYGYMVIQLFGHMLSDNISNSLKHGNMLMMISGLCDGYDNGL